MISDLVNQKARPGHQRAERPVLRGGDRLSGGRDEPLETFHPLNRDVHRMFVAEAIGLHMASRSTYGMRQIRAVLSFERGPVVHPELILRIMREQGPVGPAEPEIAQTQPGECSDPQGSGEPAVHGFGGESHPAVRRTEHKTREARRIAARYWIWTRAASSAGLSTDAMRPDS